MENQMFYNRTRETATLRHAVESSRSELMILYGRRGVGKSALIEHALALSGVPYAFYRATRRTLAIQMQALTVVARDAFPDAYLAEPFSSFSAFLSFLSHRAEGQERASGAPVVVVIDELPYLADVDPGLLTELQHWWDANKRRPNIKFFLAGSYVAFMEKQVLDANAPLYNRRTGAMKLLPMDYAEASLFFPRYAPAQKMEAYAILGGLPSYLEQFDPDRTIEENVKATILRQNSYLSEEPDWLLLEDLRRDTLYGSILGVIARGERKPSDIARAVGRKSAQDIATALDTLRDMGLVLREVPVTENRSSRSRNSLYWIADPYLDFWYRFVDPSRSLISRGLGARLWDESIAPALQEHISRPIFERASRQYLWRALADGTLPGGLTFTDIGPWWGGGDKELDMMALKADGSVALVGSCKWTNAEVDVSDYAELLGTATAAASQIGDGNGTIGDGNGTIGGSDGPWLAMFSRSGFTKRLRELAAAQDPQRLLLVTPEDMYSGVGMP